jgi:hypothetical protein
MLQVYKFQSDSALAKGWQQAEAADGMYKHPFGLPGTESWWSAIATGHLPVKTSEGVVVAYKPPGDDPGRSALFTLSDGSTWLASDDRGCSMIYREGQRVQVRYVVLQPRKSWGKEHKFVLEIERDDDA